MSRYLTIQLCAGILALFGLMANSAQCEPNRTVSIEQLQAAEQLVKKNMRVQDRTELKGLLKISYRLTTEHFDGDERYKTGTLQKFRLAKIKVVDEIDNLATGSTAPTLIQTVSPVSPFEVETKVYDYVIMPRAMKAQRIKIWQTDSRQQKKIISSDFDIERALAAQVDAFLRDWLEQNDANRTPKKRRDYSDYQNMTAN